MNLYRNNSDNGIAVSPAGLAQRNSNNTPVIPYVVGRADSPERMKTSLKNKYGLCGAYSYEKRHRHNPSGLELATLGATIDLPRPTVKAIVAGPFAQTH